MAESTDTLPPPPGGYPPRPDLERQIFFVVGADSPADNGMWMMVGAKRYYAGPGGWVER
jgi:hypothetical protein